MGFKGFKFTCSAQTAADLTLTRRVLVSVQHLLALTFMATDILTVTEVRPTEGSEPFGSTCPSTPGRGAKDGFRCINNYAELD